MRALMTGFLLAALALRAPAAIVSETVTYMDGDAELEGTFVYDDAVEGPRPGLVLFHQWSGPVAYEHMRARELADLGIVVLVADVFGKGVRPTDNESRMVEVAKYRQDRMLARSRARAAFDTLREREGVDGDRIAAIGFCFGGTIALELARDGAPLAGVVSVHGGLETTHKADAANFRPRVLALQGGSDPHVPDHEVAAFREEMRAAKADWQINEYGGAVHAFTDPGSGDDPNRGVAYHERATQRALAEVRRFLREVLFEGKTD